MKIQIRAMACLCLIFSFVSLAAFIPCPKNAPGKMAATRQKLTDSIPQEKIYLHMDKPYYALGDTIWFKGYLTIGSKHQLSALSGAMYIDLISEKDSILQQLKLPVTSGMVIGNFILKDDYLQGSYRIRAYTQWMRNADDDYFFDHTFLVGDIGDNNIVATAGFNYKDNNGKPVLSATLNYTHEDGSAWASKSIRYEIVVNHKPAWQQNSKTDASGNLRISIPDEVLKNPAGAHIHTILQTGDKYPIVRDFPIKALLSQSDIQFFPESGRLVNGINSRVAFKAVGIDGLGINIKGSVTDNDNKAAAKIETLHAGMGSFLLDPVPGKTYTANIVFEDGTTKSITLPKTIDQGYVLSVYQSDSDSILIRVKAPLALFNSSVNLIAETGGQLIFSSPLKIEKAITSLWLNKKLFPSGIAQFTLSDSLGEPLNERIAFISNHDQLALNVSAARATYHGKDHVQLALNALDSNGKPTAGNFSVSVIDESKVPMDEDKESTIFSNLLLTADLRGYVEQPNYYFAKQSDDVNRALDNLMLTQGYRRFSRKGADSTANVKPPFPAEGLGTVISGQVTTLANKPKPVAGAKLTLVSLRAKLFQTATTDAEGKFKFDPVFITDSIKFSLQARTAKGSDKVKLLLDTIPGIKVNSNPNLPDAGLNISASLKQYLAVGKKEDDAYEKLGILDKVHRLKEVNIRAKKAAPPPEIAMQGIFQVPEQSVDKVYRIPQPELCANLAICLQGALPRVVFVPRNAGRPGFERFFQNYPMYRDGSGLTDINIIVDGVKIFDPIEKGELFSDGALDATDVVKIDLVDANLALKATLGGPSILIFTNRGKVKKFYNPSIVNISPKGFNKVREFYSPRYDHPGRATQQPDLRSTIYWNPYLKTDTGGKASFDFFNADGPGTYKVIIEGINADGELGRQVFRYTVDETQPKLGATPRSDINYGNTNIAKHIFKAYQPTPYENE